MSSLPILQTISDQELDSGESLRTRLVQLLNKTVYRTPFTCRVSTDDKFYLVPLSASQEVLEIDRLNFELCLIGKLKSGLVVTVGS